MKSNVASDTMSMIRAAGVVWPKGTAYGKSLNKMNEEGIRKEPNLDSIDGDHAQNSS